MSKNVALFEIHPANSDLRVRAVTLAGNPNSGKTSLFNALTGAHQHVGNYPGVTVERKEGLRHHGGVTFRVMDLPGTYSLASDLLEERIARDVLIGERPDATVAVVEASNLARHLYLTVQLLELGLPVVVALNMVDVARSQGVVVDAGALSALLGAPVVETVARRGVGVEALLDAVRTRCSFPAPSTFRIDYGVDLEREIGRVEGLLAVSDPHANPAIRRGLAIALLEGPDTCRTRAVGEGVRRAAREGAERLRRLLGDDVDIVIAERRHGAARGLALQVTRTSAVRRRDLTDLVDSLLINRFLGLPIFLAIMATRTIESRRARLATMMVIPLMSCSARLPIYALIIQAFFAPRLQAGVLWAMYLVGASLAMAVAWLLRRTLFAGSGLPFLMELPP